MGGSKKTGTTSDVVNGVQLSTSCYGKPLPVVYGTTRLAGNVIWMPPELFVKEQGSSGGKGGGGGYSNSHYWQGFGIAICEGPITSLGRVWRDKDVFASVAAVEQGGSPFQTFLGARPQSKWSYFTQAPTYTERKTVSLTPTFVTTVINDAAFVSVLSVTSTKITQVYRGYYPLVDVEETYELTRVASNPAAGQYSVSGSTVTINTAQLNKRLTITYGTGNDLRSQGLGYGGTTYIISDRASLGDSNTMKNYSFECNGLLGAGKINPALILQDLLANTSYGMGGTVTLVTATGQDGVAASSYERWCAAAGAGFLLAPAFEEQKPFTEHLRWILDASNSECVWSEGKLKIFPLGDTTQGTYTPAYYSGGSIQPLFALTKDDLVVMDEEDEARITVTRTSLADTYNSVPVEYLDSEAAANNAYNVSSVEDVDQADFAATGSVRKGSVIALHCIVDGATAQKVSRFRAQRSLYHRNTYRFTVGWRYSLLEPGDFVSLTDPDMGLTAQLVRITTIDEDEDFNLVITAEEWKIGVASPPIYAVQTPQGSGPDLMVDPLNAATPVVLVPPLCATRGRPELWIGTSGRSKEWGGSQVLLSWDGGATYELAGEVGPATYGVLTASMAAGAPLDTAHTLSVDLGISSGALVSIPDADRDAMVRPLLVANEVIAFSTAALSSGFTYNITNLRRGCWGTVSAAHAAGERMLEIDENVLRVPLDNTRLGRTVCIKLVSFNLARHVYQDPGVAPVFTYTVPATVETLHVAPLPFFEGFDGFNLNDWQVLPDNTPGTIQLAAGVGKSGSQVMRTTGKVSIVSRTLIPFDPNKCYSLFVRIRCFTQPTTGGKGWYIGFVGVKADGVTLVNAAGLEGQYFNQHYMHDTLPGDQTWQERFGYWKGTAAAGTAAGTLASPGSLYQDVKYLRPCVYVGYDAEGDAVIDLDSVEVVEVDPVAIEAYNGASAALAVSYGGTPPANPRVGFIWFDMTSGTYVPKVWTGSIWQSVHDASLVVAAQIAAGFITGDMVAVNSLEAKHLRVGDFSNFCLNPNGEVGINDANWDSAQAALGWAGSGVDTCPAYWNGGGRAWSKDRMLRWTGRDVYYDTFFVVKPGERFQVSCLVNNANANAAGNTGFGLHCQDQFGNNLSWLSAPRLSIGSNWRLLEGTVVIPDGRAPWCVLDGSALSGWNGSTGTCATHGTVYGTQIRKARPWAVNEGNTGETDIRECMVRSADLGTITAGKIILDNGAFIHAIGPGFGTSNQFTSWFGPRPTDGNIALCNESSAKFYLKLDGSAYFGGTLAAGVYYNARQTSDQTSTASITVGPFSTKGGVRSVVCSVQANGYTTGTQQQGGQTANVYETVTIYKSVNGGAETVLATISGMHGYNTLVWDQEMGYSLADPMDFGGSVTTQDSGNPATDTITYRAAVTSRTNDHGWTCTGHIISLSSTEQ